LEKKAASAVAIRADALAPHEPPSTRYFCYIFRGSKKPIYSYKRLLANDLIEHCDVDEALINLSKAICNDLPSHLVSTFGEPIAKAIRRVVDETQK